MLHLMHWEGKFIFGEIPQKVKRSPTLKKLITLIQNDISC